MNGGRLTKSVIIKLFGVKKSEKASQRESQKSSPMREPTLENHMIRHSSGETLQQSEKEEFPPDAETRGAGSRSPRPCRDPSGVFEGFSFDYG